MRRTSGCAGRSRRSSQPKTFTETLLFKGGTSLSKVFGLIKRFSEDIDLAVDYAMLGFTGERHPLAPGLSRTKQTALLASMLEACREYIAGPFIDQLEQRLTDARDWEVVQGAWAMKWAKKPN